MRLLAVELLRLRLRQAVWLLAALAIGGVVAMSITFVLDARPPGAAEVAAAEAQVEAEREQPFYQDEYERCLESQEDGSDGELAEMYPPGFDCEEVFPQVDWYLYHDVPELVDDLRSAVPTVAILVAMAAALAGATFVGADWSAGTMGTQLVYEPRRGRVFAAKAGALALGSTVVAVVSLGILLAAVWWASARWGSTELTSFVGEPLPDGSSSGPTPFGVGDLSWLGLRAVIFVVGAALAGYLLAMAFRSSLGSVGAVAAYALAGETLVRIVWPGSEPWLLSSRTAAWLSGRFDLYDYPESCGIGSEPCEPVVTTVTMAGGAVVLGGLLLVGLASSYALFRRRDVA